MNWLSWTATQGWRVLKNAITRNDYEEAEYTRLIDGVEQLQRTDFDVHVKITEAADDRKCACCGGSRCTAWRESRHTIGCGGHSDDDGCWRTDENGERVGGCGGEGEPVPAGVGFRNLMDRALFNPGQHTIRYLARHSVPWGWNPIPLRTRVVLYPMHYARKLGRPVQIGPRRLVPVFP